MPGVNISGVNMPDVNMKASFDPGFGIRATSDPLGFIYGPDTFGPTPELRSLDAIRPSLRQPDCDGPDPVYAIAMHVGKTREKNDWHVRKMLYGAVSYAAGRLGNEPVRSQGHVHRISSHSGWSPPEVYEIWTGKAFIYMQEHVADNPGRCYAIEAGPGDLVIVPPGWAHASISADVRQPVSFGALCDREYGFEYAEVRKRRGLAWYACVDAAENIRWDRNPNYDSSDLEVRPPSDYRDFGFTGKQPLYSQVTRDFDRFQWISKPGLISERWQNFTP
jgi:glucose-6-phosphate isomerase, archaeal